jgi:predicted amidohydrolase YtcJ
MSGGSALAAALGGVAPSTVQGTAGAADARERGRRAFVGARILTITHGEIPDGTLVVQDGKIVAVRPRSKCAPARGGGPQATGRIIMPGLVDTHTHTGTAGQFLRARNRTCACSMRSTCATLDSSAPRPAGSPPPT